MRAEIASNVGGIVTAKITGKSAYPELVALQESAVGQGLWDLPIEYFRPADLPKARTWLEA